MRSMFLAAFLAGCTTDSDPDIGQPVVDRPATGPGPVEVATTTPQQEIEEGTERMPFDHAFLNAMITHRGRGQDAAKIALSRAEHPEMKAFAEETITSDEAQIAKMKELRHTWYGSAGAPASLLPSDEKAELPGVETTKDMAKDLDTLKTAEPFDRAFIDAMIPHHQGAIEMATAAAEKAQQPETKALALILVRDEQQAIDRLTALRDQWYPTATAEGSAAAP
jgi:uncharacterized protein (DUF305 family)